MYLDDTEGVGEAALEVTIREALEVVGESSFPYREEYLAMESYTGWFFLPVYKYNISLSTLITSNLELDENQVFLVLLCIMFQIFRAASIIQHYLAKSSTVKFITQNRIRIITKGYSLHNCLSSLN